ncbi:MAG: hypothetical protein CML68_13680 [Rhodobacteraceae bacterium]|nr:hypothetical protein [Paracoccaceae bacterium]
MKHEPNIHIRGKRPVSFTPCGCACCGDYPLDTEDMASTKHFTEDRLTLLTAAYSGPVCYVCCDEAETCEWCGNVVKEDGYEAMKGPDTLRFCSDSCMDDWSRAGD